MRRAILTGILLAAATAHGAEPARASAAQASTLTFYDQGFALVQELRRISLHAGENDVLLDGLPRTMDPATTAFTVTAGVKQLDLLEQSFRAASQPTAELRWVLKSGGDGFANLRISYRADRLKWSSAHELLLDAASAKGRFSTRIGLDNQSGHAFSNARVRLAITERGGTARLPIEAGTASNASPMRFAYGQGDAQPDRLVAGLTTVQTYEMPGEMTLPDATLKYTTWIESSKLAVRRFCVYDGVRFDRFQRNRQTDWNYGTTCHNVVDAYVEFDNDEPNGLGRALPPGRLRLLQRTGDAVDFLGELLLPAIPEKGTAHARIGPARGLHGERERVGFTEIKPGREYEESFEIRLRNEGDEAATVRVVEHLYRGEDFEIVKADAEYRKVGAQTIEFAPDLKPGGQRSVHYTVRYRW